MTGFSDFLGRIVGGVFKLVFGLLLAVFVLSLLLALLVLVLVLSVWSLLTGRKPAPLVLFKHFRQFSRRSAGSVWTRRSDMARPSGRPADVVDVQAHEVPDPTPAGAADHAASKLRAQP